MFLWRRFLKVPVSVNNLGLLEQLAYWKVSAACSAAGYNATMKKHGYDPHTANRFTSRLRLCSCDFRSTSSVSGPNSSAPTGCWEKWTKWIKWTILCRRSCRWAAGAEAWSVFSLPAASRAHSLCFLSDRKRAETWRRASVWWKLCRPKFQLSGGDSARRSRVEPEKVRGLDFD